MRRLIDPDYLSFPFQVGPDGPQTSRRQDHVRQQIEQVLFTDPGERVFRPEFGAGVRTLVFEPNASPLWETTRKRLVSSLSDALFGEVDPRTLDVQVKGEEATLTLVISYQLTTLGRSQEQRFQIARGIHG